jgi:hypothetical protein
MKAVLSLLLIIGTVVEEALQEYVESGSTFYVTRGLDSTRETFSISLNRVGREINSDCALKINTESAAAGSKLFMTKGDVSKLVAACGCRARRDGCCSTTAWFRWSWARTWRFR